MEMGVKERREVLGMKIYLRKSNCFSGNFRRHVEALNKVSKEIKRKEKKTER